MVGVGLDSMNIVILTKNYGSNFTGATMATNVLSENWIHSHEVNQIIVFAKNVGDISNVNVRLIRFTSLRDFKNKFRREKFVVSDCVFYSDDHLGYYFSKLGVDYFHTYHGNWPDARWISPSFFIKSFYFIPIYIRTIKNAKMVINVSKYMEKFTNKYNRNHIIIHNGVPEKNFYPNLNEVGKINHMNNKIVMVGNIDSRKYKYLYQMLSKYSSLMCSWDIYIYGKILDKKLYSQLIAFPNVHIMGFKDTIRYQDYDLFICTSTSENLPISICEALVSGLPVISFDVGGISEVICSKNGSIIPKYELSSFISAIEKYFNNNSEYEYDAEKYKDLNWKSVSKKYMNIFVNGDN